jgi:hypothetical protein
MSDAISLAELRRSGITFTADEAVALVQTLIHQHDADAARPPFGPPSVQNVIVAEDGSVACRSCEMTPSVLEAAILLQELLAEAAHVPGGLRYAIARALHDVDAPPFDSIEEFSAALARYGPRDRDAIVRRLMTRARSIAGVSPISARAERRRSSASPEDLRRLLRDADRRFYETRAPGPVPVAPPSKPQRVLLACAVLAGSLVAIGAGELMRPRAIAMPAVAPALVATPAEIPAIAYSESTNVHSIISRPAVEVKTQAKRPIRVSRASVGRDRHANRNAPAPGVLDKLRLRWVHSVILLRDDLAGKP